MAADLNSFETQVDQQQADLANDIRNAEDKLMRLKEVYLKVKGDKEMLTLIKSLDEDKPSEAVEELEKAIE